MVEERETFRGRQEGYIPKCRYINWSKIRERTLLLVRGGKWKGGWREVGSFKGLAVGSDGIPMWCFPFFLLNGTIR